MPIKNGIMEKPISVADVAKVLGSTSLDVGTLCRDSNINPYALYSPRFTTKPGSIINKDFTSEVDPTSRYPSGASYKVAPYGILIPGIAADIGVGLTAFNFARLQWIIPRPDDKYSFKCLHHFEGYKHDAQPGLTFNMLFAGSTMYDAEICGVFSIPADDGYTLSIAKLFGEADTDGNKWYPAVVVYETANATPGNFTAPMKDPATNAAVFKGTTPVTTAGGTFTVFTGCNTDPSGGRYYTAVPFVCKKRGTGTDVFPVDYDFFNVAITADIRPVEKYVPVPGEVGNDTFQYFHWKEGSGGAGKPDSAGNVGGDRRYPDGATYDSGTPLPTSGITSTLCFAYCENVASVNDPLYNKYTRLELTIYYDGGDGGKSKTYRYTKGASDNTLIVDDRCRSLVTLASKLLMYLSTDFFKSPNNTASVTRVRLGLPEYGSSGNLYYRDGVCIIDPQPSLD